MGLGECDISMKACSEQAMPSAEMRVVLGQAGWTDTWGAWIRGGGASERRPQCDSWLQPPPADTQLPAAAGPTSRYLQHSSGPVCEHRVCAEGPLLLLPPQVCPALLIP